MLLQHDVRRRRNDVFTRFSQHTGEHVTRNLHHGVCVTSLTSRFLRDSITPYDSLARRETERSGLDYRPGLFLADRLDAYLGVGSGPSASWRAQKAAPSSLHLDRHQRRSLAYRLGPARTAKTSRLPNAVYFPLPSYVVSDTLRA